MRNVKTLLGHLVISSASTGLWISLKSVSGIYHLLSYVVVEGNLYKYNRMMLSVCVDIDFLNKNIDNCKG